MIDPLVPLLFWAHVAATLYMVGLIWFVQVVHYPLFACVGREEFPAYEKFHTRWITWVVGPPMLIEGITALGLTFYRPPGLLAWPWWTSLVLLVGLWLSTAAVQMPCHMLLSHGFDAVVHRRLVNTNWLRTVAWSARGLLLLWIAFQFLGNFDTMKQMKKLEMGDKAPNFATTTYDGRPISLADYLGKRSLVVFFYPKDGTPVCTQEACAFRDSYEKFVEAGTEVIGVSGDREEIHRSFAQNHKLTFPLISDSDGSMRRAFGVPKTLGILPGRVTYVIDKEGIIRHVFSALFASDEHVHQALAAIGAANLRFP
jgi:peroxiredoxin Q/BCP